MMESLNCPWDGYEVDPFVTCETSLCAWIREPANTWSNLIFFVVGFYLIYRGWKQKQNTDMGFGVCALLIGAISFMAHASGTTLFGFLDFASIFVLFSLMFVLAWFRFHKNRNLFHCSSLYCSLLFPSLLMMVFFEYLRVPIFIFFVAGLLFLEAKHFDRVCELKKLHHSLFIAVAIFFTGALALLLDFTGWVCQPDNHYFQLHSVWHMTNAISLIFIARYFRQFSRSLQ